MTTRIRKQLKDLSEAINEVDPYSRARMHVFPVFAGETNDQARALYEEQGHVICDHDTVVCIRRFSFPRPEVVDWPPSPTPI